MAWKQLIPTNIGELCGNDGLATTILIYLLLRAASKPKVVEIEGQSIQLQRGECICGTFELTKTMGFPKSARTKVYRKLSTLQKVHNIVNITRHSKCSVVTIKNFDDIVGFEQQNEQHMHNTRNSHANKLSSVSSKTSITGEGKILKLDPRVKISTYEEIVWEAPNSEQLLWPDY